MLCWLRSRERDTTQIKVQKSPQQCLQSYNEASEPWCGATLEGREQCIQPVVSLRVTTYSQLFCHFRGSLRPFRSERHVLRLASGRSTNHDPPPFFQRAQAMTQIAFICRQGLHQVLVAT